MVEELFLDGVLAEPGDRAQPPGHRGPCPARGLKVPAEALDVGPAHAEQRQAVVMAPAGELAQVQRVGLAVRPEYPARNPAKASRSGSENTGPAGARAVEMVGVVMGTSRVGRDNLRPGSE